MTMDRRRSKKMKQMPAGAFKARCLADMKKVQMTGEPVIVTKRGAPVVKLVPVESEKNDIFGFMAGKVKIVGDIESPIPIEWKVTRK
jgi:antitoxin (DNA-binding transcriptional repressor) of toxin-antitoxin stability system